MNRFSCFSLFLLASSAFSSEIQVGAGIALESNIYIKGSNSLSFFPFASYDGERLNINTINGASYVLLDNDFVELSIDGDIRSSSKPDELIEKDKTVLDLGFSVEIWLLNASFNSSVTDASAGYEAEISASYPITGKNWAIKPETGVKFKDKQAVNFDYGYAKRIQEKYALPEFKSESAHNPFFKLTGIYRISKNLQLTGLIEHEILHSNITQSTIVKSKEQSSVAILLAYIF